VSWRAGCVSKSCTTEKNPGKWDVVNTSNMLYSPQASRADRSHGFLPGGYLILNASYILRSFTRLFRSFRAFFDGATISFVACSLRYGPSVVMGRIADMASRASILRPIESGASFRPRVLRVLTSQCLIEVRTLPPLSSPLEESGCHVVGLGTVLSVLSLTIRKPWLPGFLTLNKHSFT